MAFKFDKQSGERIAKEVRSHERRVRGVIPPIKSLPIGSGTSLQLAKVSSAISARTGTTLGKGKVRLFDVDDNELKEESEETEVLNFWATEIDVKDYVLIGDCTGGLFVLGRECAEDDDEVTTGA